MRTTTTTTGVIAIIAGAAGLWAVFGPNALAAKVYLWTWFPRFIAMMATEIVEYFMMKDIGVDQFPAATIVAELVNVVLIMYFVKVLTGFECWCLNCFFSSALLPGAHCWLCVDGGAAMRVCRNTFRRPHSCEKFPAAHRFLVVTVVGGWPRTKTSAQ